MIKERDIQDALHAAYQRAGTQAALARTTGVTQSTIADYLNGRYAVGNMTVGVLLKLFPEMSITFFPKKDTDSTVRMIRSQLLEIFDSLDESDKIRMLTMSAARFNETLRRDNF